MISYTRCQVWWIWLIASVFMIYASVGAAPGTGNQGNTSNTAADQYKAMLEATAPVDTNSLGGVDVWLLAAAKTNGVSLGRASKLWSIEPSIMLRLQIAGIAARLVIIDFGVPGRGDASNNYNALTLVPTKGGHPHRQIRLLWQGHQSSAVMVEQDSILKRGLVDWLRQQKNESFDIALVKNASTLLDVLENPRLPWPPESAWYYDSPRSSQQVEYEASLSNRFELK